MGPYGSPRRTSRWELLLPPGRPWPATGWPRGLTRRMWAPTGQRIPFGSPEPSACTYSKSFHCSGGRPSGGLSVSGDKARGTPLRHRPHIFAASSSGIDLVPVRLQERFEGDDVGLDLLEHSEAAVQAQCSRLGHVVAPRVFPQHEEPGLAGFLVIGQMGLRAAADGGRGDGVGVPEVDLGRRHGLAVLHLHQGHPVLPPDLSEGVTLGEPGAQAIAVAASAPLG